MNNLEELPQCRLKTSYYVLLRKKTNEWIVRIPHEYLVK